MRTLGWMWAVTTLGGCGELPIDPAGAGATSATTVVALQASETGPAPAIATYGITIAGEALRLDLVRNDDLFAADYTEHRTVDGVVHEVPAAERADAVPCYYLGSITAPDGTPRGRAAVRTCDGATPHQITGQLQLADLTLAIRPLGGERHAVTPVALPDLPCEVHGHALTGPPTAPTVGDLRPPPSVVYTETLIVNDVARWAALGAGAEIDSATTHNIVTGVFLGAGLDHQVRHVLTGQHSFTSADPFSPSLFPNGEVDATDLLGVFLTWAANQDLDADHLQLSSHRDFGGATVGLAPLGGMCLVAQSGSIVQSTSSVAATAAIASHEIGHSLGMVHDASANACGAGFIMAESGSPVGPQPDTFSSCSIDEANALFATGQLDCLADVPESAFDGPACGNGLVEAGEACDCGPNGCAGIDACCDGSTCQLVPAATCSAADPCCDEASCAIVGAGVQQICRESQGACDSAEVCDGVAAACPTDVTALAGTACGTDGGCYLGECVSHIEQCEVWDDVFIENIAFLDVCSFYTDPDPCGPLICGVNGTGCTSFLDQAGNDYPFEEGTPCGTDSQCVEGVCTPSIDLQPQPEVPVVSAITGSAGGSLSVDIDDATPGATVHVVLGRPGGPINVPGCPGVTVGLRPGLTVLGSITADGTGSGVYGRNVPASASSLTRTIFAVELSACAVSDPAAHTF